MFHTFDVYKDGKPTNVANLPAGAEPRQGEGDLPISETICEHTFTIPWFKHFHKDIIDEHVAAVRKVVENHKELLKSDPKIAVVGKFFQTARKN